MHKKDVEQWLRARLRSRLGVVLAERSHEVEEGPPDTASGRSACRLYKHAELRLGDNELLLSSDESNPVWRVFHTAKLRTVAEHVCAHCDANGITELDHKTKSCCDLLCAAMCPCHDDPDHEDEGKCSGWCKHIKAWHDAGELG